MVHAVIYGMRGWIAFVAFIEFSNAIRCFIDERQFFGNLLPESEIVSSVAARLFGRYFLLNGVIMVHCALFIHHMPVISLSICSLTLSILLYLSEAFYYYNFLLNFYIIFPTLISFSTVICLLIAPCFIEDEPKRSKLNYYEEEEEDEEDYETKVIKQRTSRGKSNSTGDKVKLKSN